MNKTQQYNKMREVLNEIRHTSLSGNKEGYFYAYASESENHIRKKFEVWLKLKKAGYKLWCESIFKSGIRMDILAFREGIFTNYEILENETIRELEKKTEKYPSEINIIPIKTDQDVNDLEMF